MIEQIATSVVMFLLGGVLTYFSTRWSRTLRKINALECGVQALLRDRMIQVYTYYRKTGEPIPQRVLAAFEAMYAAYKALGGNGYMDEVHKKFMEEMPHEIDAKYI